MLALQAPGEEEGEPLARRLAGLPYPVAAHLRYALSPLPPGAPDVRRGRGGAGGRVACWMAGGRPGGSVLCSCVLALPAMWDLSPLECTRHHTLPSPQAGDAEAGGPCAVFSRQRRRRRVAPRESRLLPDPRRRQRQPGIRAERGGAAGAAQLGARLCVCAERRRHVAVEAVQVGAGGRGRVLVGESGCWLERAGAVQAGSCAGVGAGGWGGWSLRGQEEEAGGGVVLRLCRGRRRLCT